MSESLSWQDFAVLFSAHSFDNVEYGGYLKADEIGITENYRAGVFWKFRELLWELLVSHDCDRKHMNEFQRDYPTTGLVRCISVRM